MPKKKDTKPARVSSAGKFLELLRKIFTLNIGTILFGVLFLYMVFSAVVYLTNTHYTTYQVISGPLSRNETYTGLVLKEEAVVTSNTGGYLTYYAREGNKINADGAVFGVSSSKSAPDVQPLDQEDLSQIRQQMSNFSNSFDLSNYNDTYSFKYELEGNILHYATSQTNSGGEATISSEESGEEKTVTAASDLAALTLGNQTVNKAVSDGIILYSKDGYEGKAEADLTAEDFDQNAYLKTDLKTEEAIDAGQEVYTIITDELWNLYIPLSQRQAANLADRTSIKVKFLKDGNSQTGDFDLVEIDGNTYGRLTFNKGLIRYASDRFLDIELVTNIQSGLKIPLSAIVSKDFYIIPEAYATQGGNSSSMGFLKSTDGGKTTEFVSPDIFGYEPGDTEEENGGYYYVEKASFSEGDMLAMPDSSGTFVIGETDSLEGVFSINKGYPVFRRIVILDQNEEFAIVEKRTTYGLSQYDYIVQDASKVDDKDVIS